MDTYGDLVTLLLCFFVLLFALSSVDSAKWQALVGSFTGQTIIQIPELSPAEGLTRQIERIPRSKDTASEITLSSQEVAEINGSQNDFKQLLSNIQSYVKENNLGAEIEVNYDDYQVVMRFSDSILFDSGQATLRDDSYSILNHMTTVFELNNDLIESINVEGHTDTNPINTARFPDNWSLSTERAWAVVRYLAGTQRVENEKMIGIGRGEYAPIDTNDTAEGQQKNRRVDFIVQAYTAKINLWRSGE